VQIDRTTKSTQALNVNEVIVSAECLLRRLAGREVELTIEYDPDLDLVRADPAQIELILLIMMVHMREAVAGAGTINLCTANAEMEHVDNAKDTLGSYVTISMRGACDDLVDRPQGSTSELWSTVRGTDLCASPDLFVVEDIVRECGGHIELKEESDHSVSLTLYLPGIDDTETART
jgi:nitrogen-specific signal transduction histidine kinase